ncbi:MAG: type II secretion system F family protein, partial [Armatimonadaceae bacterium]
MPLATGLILLARQFGDPRLRALSEDAAREISQGFSLSSALGHAPAWIPSSLQMLVRCGEQSGRLPESLAEAQRQLERSAATRRRITTAAAYPVATLVLSAVVVGILIPWILPTFEKIYEDLRAPLPPTTRALLTAWHAIADQAGW